MWLKWHCILLSLWDKYRLSLFQQRIVMKPRSLICPQTLLIPTNKRQQLTKGLAGETIHYTRIRQGSVAAARVGTGQKLSAINPGLVVVGLWSVNLFPVPLGPDDYPAGHGSDRYTLILGPEIDTPRYCGTDDLVTNAILI